jgi:hypothetical protein
MKESESWLGAIRRGAVSGAIASLSSTAVLSRCGSNENGTPYAPTNAISHWIWGERAMYQNHPSAQHTLLGYAIHHASATLWAVIYEKWLGHTPRRKTAVPALAGGVAVAALACFVDYNLTPKRLRPGYEKRLSRKSLFFVYSIFGLTLAACKLLDERR